MHSLAENNGSEYFKLMKTIRILYVACIVALLVFTGCSLRSDKTNGVMLKVDVIPKEVAFGSIFESCEIIPLETTPLSLMSEIDKALCFDDGILLLDMRRSVVCLFNNEGSFLNRIGERGQGPEDYLLCYDFSLNNSTNEVTLLSPYGEIINYDLNGRFVSRKGLPSKPNYFACLWLNQNDLALWSEVDTDEGGVSVVNVDSGELYYDDWYNDRIIDMCNLKPFFRYKDSVLFSAPLTNAIYQVSDSSMYPVYKWVFGEKGVSAEYINRLIEIQDPTERNKRLISDLESGLIAYAVCNGENEYYYFVALATRTGDNKDITSIFYDKSESTSIAIRSFKEGITLHPLFMNEEFVLSIVNNDEIEIFNSLFDLNCGCNEDDNPLLAKFYFKKPQAEKTSR